MEEETLKNTPNDNSNNHLTGYNYETLGQFPSILDVFENRLSNQYVETLAEKEEKAVKVNIIRLICRKIVTWKFFDFIIIVLIIINSILLGIIDYENPDSDSIRNRIVNTTEPFFTSVFTLEAILKIIA